MYNPINILATMSMVYQLTSAESHAFYWVKADFLSLDDWDIPLLGNTIILYCLVTRIFQPWTSPPLLGCANKGYQVIKIIISYLKAESMVDDEHKNTNYTVNASHAERCSYTFTHLPVYKIVRYIHVHKHNRPNHIRYKMKLL